MDHWAFHLLSPRFDTQSLGQVYLHQIFYLQNQLGFRIHASPSNYFRGKVWLQKCDFESINHRRVEKKLVIMINNILSSKFHFQKWWSGFCFRKTRSVTFPKFPRKKLWPGTQYFCLDFVSVNHGRWRSQIRIFKIFLDFVTVKHGGWFPDFRILFPWFANKG